MEENKKPLFEMRHTRVPAQQNKMAEATRLGICPFCWENLNEWHDAPVIKKGGWWAITENDYPYPGAKHHYLAIYRQHISSFEEIDAAAGYELFRLFSWVCKEFKIPGAAIIMRSGEMIYTGATVFHLHAQIMSGASREEIEKVSEIKYPDSFITSVLGYKIPKLK